MRTLFARATAVAASAILTSAAFALPASADVRTFPDAGGHITAIKVSHAPVNIAVKATDAEMTIGTVYTFWLDTDSSDPGPEYKTKIFPDSDGMFLSSVDEIGDAGNKIDCDGFRAQADTSGPGFVKITVPRSCVGTPDSVRVTIRGYYAVPGPNIIDWAPGTKKFTGAVNV